MLMRWLCRCGWFGGLGVTLIGAALVLAAPAGAAFPGRDGLLAVQPLSGPGIVLVGADGHGTRRVCAQPGDPCDMADGQLVRPQWAPDGGTLLIDRAGYNESGAFEVIYPDGSCLACLGGPFVAMDASFTRNPTLYTAVTPLDSSGLTPGLALVEYSIDGLKRRTVIAGGVADPVWSSRGELALVRGGRIWVGSPGRLRRIARGSAPSWSPHGRQVAFVRRGWLMVGAVRRRSFRRLVRGAAPAWSPDGSLIAFFDKHHRLSVVSATSRRVRRVGSVTGQTVDWQPLPAKPHGACVTPAGSNVLATSDTAIITVDHAQSASNSFYTTAYMGCFRADGRERLLASYPYVGYGTENVVEASVAGAYGALAVNTANSHDQSMSSAVDLFDLRTGLLVPGRGGEEADCVDQSSPPCASNIDQLVLGSDAVSAVHTTVRDASCEPIQDPSCGYAVEQIQASDSTGVHTLDSAGDGSPTALTDLVLTGDTLTWDHNGSPRSAQLQP